MPLVIKTKRNAVGLFQGSLAEDGTMFILSYFYTQHHRLQRTFETSIMQKFALKNFFKYQHLCALLKQSNCSCAVLFPIFGCGICVCALKRLEFSLRNLQLRFKLLRFWLRNSHLRFKQKNFVAEFALAL